MKKLGTRLISAALAVCMVATVLPVSAFATRGGTEAENGVSEQAAGKVLSHSGETITEPGTYELQGGEYTGSIIINLPETTGEVTINVTGDVKVTGRIKLLNVGRVGSLTIHSENRKIYAPKPIEANLLVLNPISEGAEVTVCGGTYSGYGAPMFVIEAGTLNLEGISVTDPDDPAAAGSDSNIVSNGGTVNITGKTFISNRDGAPTIYTGEGAVTNIHSGTYKNISNSGQVFGNRGELTIDADKGKTFISSQNGTSAAIGNVGTLNFYGGTVESRNSAAISSAGSTASAMITGGTVQNSKYGIRVSRGNPTVTLKDVAFENNENDICLGADQKITIEDSFKDRATVKVAESTITTPRVITTDTAPNQDKLNLVSNDTDANGSRYLVAYDEATGHRYLTTRGEDQYIVSAERVAATADGQTLNSYTPVSAGTDVTLTADAPDEGWVFTGWQVTSPTGGINVTMPDGETVNLQDITDTTVTFTMPASDVAVSAQYEYVGVSSDGGDSGAGAVVAGALLGGTAYLLTTRVWLENTLGFVPENRIELATALWKRADCPAPVSTELYPDIDEDDTDAQAAARWCVEQDLMKDFARTNSDGTQTVNFKPYDYVFRPQSLVKWYKLEKLLNEQQSTNA